MLSVQKLLDGKARNVIFSLAPDNTVMEALELMEAADIGAIMVMDNGQLSGIFSERDYTRKGILKGRKAKTTPLRDVMRVDVITVDPGMNIKDCMMRFTNKYVRHLPVLSEGKVIGLLSIGDIVHAIMSEQTDHIEYLEKYIAGT